MIPVEVAISRFRRDLAVAATVRGLLVGTAVVCLVGGQWFGNGDEAMVPLFIVAGIWMALSYRSMVGSRLAAGSSALIAAGHFDQAEVCIDSALRRFSLFGTAKLLSLHHLAVLRHAQHRWGEAAVLGQALRRRVPRALPGLLRSTLLLTADSLLQIGDLRGAFEAMNELYGQHLALGEALTLQLLQLEYGSRVEAWESMLGGIATKVQLSELMATPSAARSQSLMALAARKTGRTELADWLQRRADLLAEGADQTPAASR